MSYDDMGPLPRTHNRTKITTQAGFAINDALYAVESQYNLTTYEILIILNNYIARVLKSALRAERHPNQPGKPADQA